MSDKITREKIIDFLKQYRHEFYQDLLIDMEIDDYENLSDFQQGALYGLKLAYVAIKNADAIDLEKRI